MALAAGVKKEELPRIGLIKKPRTLNSLPPTALASLESLSMPLVQEVVLSADIRCAECQNRVAGIMSRLSETESVLVNVLEKKVTLTCRYPSVVKVSTRQICCMVMRINIDCNGCFRKMRRILLNMKEIETHMIEKQHCKISICGRFRPSDIAIKLRKKMNRRVEILEIQEFSDSNEQDDQKATTTG